MDKHSTNYIVKIADTENEFQMIHRLNYNTFVEEIPQHHRNGSGLLIDRFHQENTYIILLDGERLAGMVAARGNRPFSLDFKIPELDTYLPEKAHICEIRLLAIDKEYRGRFAFFKLASALIEYLKSNNYNYAVISGTTRQQKLYRHLGFQPFYHLVGTEGALYQPMYITTELFEDGVGKLFKK